MYAFKPGKHHAVCGFFTMPFYIFFWYYRPRTKVLCAFVRSRGGDRLTRIRRKKVNLAPKLNESDDFAKISKKKASRSINIIEGEQIIQLVFFLKKSI